MNGRCRSTAGLHKECKDYEVGWLPLPLQESLKTWNNKFKTLNLWLRTQSENQGLAVTALREHLMRAREQQLVS